MLCAKLKLNKADAIVEHGGCEEVPFEVEGINFSLDEGKGVMTFIFECRVFLDAGGVFSASGGGVFLDSGGVSVASGG